MPFYVYILESLKDGSLYIGSSGNVAARLQRHNSGQTRYTSRKLPWRILGTITCATKAEAIILEKKLKRWKNPARLRHLLGQNIHKA
jgi:putative endonuclease